MKKKNVDEAMADNEVADFKKKLYAGEVKFKYIKADGSERIARGTMKPSLLPPPPEGKQYDKDKLTQKKPPRRKPVGVVCYYDLDSQGFRSFRQDRFVEIVES